MPDQAGADVDLLAPEDEEIQAFNLRTDTDAVQFVRSFFEAGKPVGAICHAPWTLINADVVDGRRLTSWPSLQTDLRNAGAEWVDEEILGQRLAAASAERKERAVVPNQVVPKQPVETSSWRAMAGAES